MTVISDIKDARLAAQSANLRLEESILRAYEHRVKVTEIAQASGFSRMQVNRIINKCGATLRLPPPDRRGLYTDSVGRMEKAKPHWLVASVGSGAVRGWYFREEDAVNAKEEGQYHRPVNHSERGWE
ncbi:hypothetical protein [Paeniglutamicibacter kerguelensis]|uniref:Uncharacterized protein n=1 Tax=Paeniglutamicibacter kerguelensis TaxID=254788 RepID=A0ABS4XJ46_9MICC|nr:hypothetical protein [Paeniglutamicibacter kerguelensis]MBP2388346.1 hypothetical protein [Paeniglutamicibacter kerguelensis]MBP2388357.1 hypothetical protein [Paeniglutamicibacter kerguelensis]